MKIYNINTIIIVFIIVTIMKLKLYLIFFVLTCSFLQSTTKMIPNIEYTTLGYDMRIGQIDDIKTVKNPVLSTLTYYNNYTTTLNNTIYSSPDQLLIYEFSTEEYTNINQVYTSQMTLQESMAESYSTGYNPWFTLGMFSSSSNSYYFHELYQMNAEYMAISYLYVTSFRAKLNVNTKNIKLNPIFEQELLNLPNDYNSTTCNHYKNFFNTFGTHFVYYGTFGGIFEMSTSFSVELLQDKTVAEVQKDLNTQFFLLTTSENLTEEQEQELSYLNLYYKSTFKLVGGSPGYNRTQYQQWASTVFSSPLIINMEFYNFTVLLNDSLKINALNNAMTEYFYSSYSNWQVVNEMPYALANTENLVHVLVDTSVYFPISESYNQGYYYNLKTNLWNQITPIYNQGMYLPVCSSVKDSIYCFVDDVSNSFVLVYTFDTKTNSWFQLPDISESFKYGSAIANNDYIYVFGSSSQWTYVNTKNIINIIPNPILIYNIVDYSLQQLYYEMPICLLDVSTIKIENDVYSFGGRYCNIYNDNGYYYKISNDTLKFNMLTYQWSILEPMPILLYSFGISVIKNTIFIMGGSVIEYLPVKGTNFKPNYSIYAYDTTTNGWETVTNDSATTASIGISVSDKGFMYYMSNSINVVAPNNFC